MKEDKSNYDEDILSLLDSKFPEHLYDDKYEFPYRVTLSFEILFKHIKKAAESGSDARRRFAEYILDEIEKHPHLKGVIEDPSILKNHQTLLNDMMLFVFPDAFLDQQLFAASTPFMSNVFYASSRFQKIIKIVDANIQGELNIDEKSFKLGKMVSVFSVIIQYFYDSKIQFDFPLVYKVMNPESGLDMYYKMNFASEFLDIKLNGELPPLSNEQINSIKKNIYDFDFVTSLLSPSKFEFSGFLVMNAINITDTEILSAIKNDLLDKNTINTIGAFLKLQHKLKSLLRCPGLLIGITEYSGKVKDIFKYGSKIGNSFLMNDKCIKENRPIDGSVYDYVFKNRKSVVIENLEEHPDKTLVEEEILKQGINSILLSPLMMNDELIGVLEIGSPNAGNINRINVVKLRELLPLFAIAVARRKEEFDNKVEAIIKEKCTAIHASLEWRFRKAAINLLMKEAEGEKAEMEEIIFENVFPLFGLSDIRNSSVQRNEAIRDDLVENINLAKEVIELAKKQKSLYIFDDLLYRLDKKINSISFGINSGDESRILSFLKNNIVSLFDYLKTLDGSIVKAVDNYESQLDSKLGFVYHRRKSYEESASRISNMIAYFLDEEQMKMQKLFPHYYERYKTDGVEHNIYVGESLVEDQIFDPLYLKNIRMWQMIVTCEIARMSRAIKKSLSIQLETAHLILVQNMPLAVRFKFDEKKFDVDGAYNIRYEIMKKRIDKAEVKGKEERVTQPDKIAIVYSQDGEAQEYLNYIEYLQSADYLKKEIEELEIEELQGVTGLKALRVGVKPGSSVPGELKTENLIRAMKEIP